MTTEVALAPQPDSMTSTVINMRLARELAESRLLAAGLVGEPASVLLTMLTGRELGIGPMAALRLIYVVEGKPTLSGQLQLALLRKAGHRVKEVEVTPERVTLEGVHAITGDMVRVSYTLDEVPAANRGKKNWRDYAHDMIYWRCVSRLARRLDPTAVGGMYSPDDFDQPSEAVTVTVGATAPAEPETVASEVVDALPADDQEKTERLRTETRRLLRDTPVASKPTKAEMEEAKLEGGPEAVYDLVMAAHEKFMAEEEAALKGEPEPGELPLNPQDALLPILVSCPSCDAKVDTHELQAHLREHHGGDLGAVE